MLSAMTETEIENPVRIESGATPEEAKAVVDAFKRAGLEVEVDAAIELRAGGATDVVVVLPWIVQVALKYTVDGFFLALGAKGFDLFVRDVWSAREGREGRLEITDPEHTWVMLRNSMPDEAIDALSELDWSEKRGDLLEWDFERRKWRDPTKREPRP
jgi:hypothetical protein